MKSNRDRTRTARNRCSSTPVKNHWNSRSRRLSCRDWSEHTQVRPRNFPRLFMDETKLKSNPAKRGGWLRKLLLIGGLFLVLLVMAFFVVTSGAFVKAVILPKVGAALDRMT